MCWNPHVKSWSLGMVSLVTHALRDPAQVERNLISRVLVEGMREKPTTCTQLKCLSNNPEVLWKFNLTAQPDGNTTKLAEIAGKFQWLTSTILTGLLKCHLHDLDRAAGGGECYMSGTAGTPAWQQAVRIVSTQNQFSSPLSVLQLST